MLMAVAMLAVAGCKEKDEVQHRIVGEWFYSTEESGQKIEIYIGFSSDFTFDLYQKVGEGRHRHMTGTYEVDRTLVSGFYSDRTPWASDYYVSFTEGRMIMESATVQNYSIKLEQKRIPDDVRQNCVEMTRSGDLSEEFFL